MMNQNNPHCSVCADKSTSKGDTFVQKKRESRFMDTSMPAAKRPNKTTNKMLEPNITIITGPKPCRHAHASPKLYNARREGSKKASTKLHF